MKSVLIMLASEMFLRYYVIYFDFLQCHQIVEPSGYLFCSIRFEALVVTCVSKLTFEALRFLFIQLFASFFAHWLSTSDISVQSILGSVVTFDVRAKHRVVLRVYGSFDRWCLWKKTFRQSSKEELRLLSRVAYCSSVPCAIDRDE